MRLFLRALPIAVTAAIIVVSSGVSAQTPPDISHSLENMTDQPATHFGLVFDRSMLQAARSVLESGGMARERAAAALSSISFDNYRYALPAAYAPGTMNSIIAAYHSGGWKHLVDAHGGPRDPYTGVAEKGATTDLWLHFSGTDIDGVSVLTRSARNMTVVQVACDLRPLDLIHLSGHFGIPKVDPNAVMVPAPDNR
jgi:hypothetical protein